MKQYSFEFNGQTYKLDGLTTAVKSEFMVPVRARLIEEADRLFAKKLIKMVRYLSMMKSAEQAGFHSPACAEELSTDDGRKRLLSLMVVPRELATPEFMDALYEETKNSKSSIYAATVQISKDAFPDAPDTPEEEGEESGPKPETPKS
jgi:hypothetical protein